MEKVQNTSPSSCEREEGSGREVEQARGRLVKLLTVL